VAVIEDRKGPDRLLVLDGAGVHRFDEGAELGPPAWSPAGRLTYVAGSSTLVIRDGDVVLRFGPPPGALSIHSPAFPDDSAPVVVAEEPVAGYRGHDTALNNLWRLDLTTGTWSRLTDFRAAGDDWIAIRTPVARTDGSLAFVVIGGNARDGQMRPGLWTWAPQSGARHERDLAGQFFLAGVVGQELLWNFLDDDLQWKLGTLAPDGDFHQIACGRVLVDPQDVTDPDLESAVPESVPDPSVEAAGPSAPVGVIVGDFDSRREAANVARRLGAKLGPVRVVGHDDAPLAIAPGKWGAVWVVPPATPPTPRSSSSTISSPSMKPAHGSFRCSNPDPRPGGGHRRLQRWRRFRSPRNDASSGLHDDRGAGRPRRPTVLQLGRGCRRRGGPRRPRSDRPKGLAQARRR
jgi:hypothetical protein